MNKPLSVGTRASAAIAAAATCLMLHACATTPRPATGSNAGPPDKRQNSACIKDNIASRIKQVEPRCAAGGRSYSSDDIERTGATTTGQALQLLDPSITVGH